MTEEFTHLDKQGRVKMVDVSNKQITSRMAVASGTIRFSTPMSNRLLQGNLPKGDVLTVAKIAGIQAAKNTSLLIPLCHPLSLSQVEITFKVITEQEISVLSEVKAQGKTGVEMEALTSLTVCLLTIYDMCKAIDKNMEITDIHLVHKEGGRSGFFHKEVGKVLSLNVSKNKGEKKSRVSKAVFLKNQGLKGDAHVGSGEKQVSLLAIDSINKMKALGVKVEPGSFAENITIEGFNFDAIRLNTLFYLGKQVKLRVTHLGKECLSPCAIGQQVGDCVMPREGIFAEVLEGGEVLVGERVIALTMDK